MARRGYHVSREYGVDPLERLSIGDVMTTDVITVPASLPLHDLVLHYFLGGSRRVHQGYPVVDEQNRLVGMLTKSDLLEDWLAAALKGGLAGRRLGPAHHHLRSARRPAHHGLPVGIVPGRRRAHGTTRRRPAHHRQPRRSGTPARYRDPQRPAQAARDTEEELHRERLLLRPNPAATEAPSGRERSRSRKLTATTLDPILPEPS